MKENAAHVKIFEGGSLDSKPVFVGIDQSYSGFAVTRLNKSGFKTTVYKSEYRGVERLADIQSHLRDVLSLVEVKDVAIEGYAFGSQMANMLGELGGMVKLTLFKLGHYPLIIPPTTLKKYVTGKGQGVSKSQIMLQVYKKWGVEFSDDNAADSFALAHLVSGQASLTYEKEIYKKVQDPKYRER
jgi:Holliday junction resolvasome RuvABC endonuclease subunit